VRGVALMTSMLPVSILALGTLPPQRVQNASGLFNLTRNLGGAFGLAGITTFLNKRDDLHIERLREVVTWSRQPAAEHLSNLTAGFQANPGLDAPSAALKTLANIVQQQALVMAFSDVFLILAGLFFAVLLLVPLAKKPENTAAAGAGH
jgi:DHA2 family multidrug resistance protein